MRALMWFRGDLRIADNTALFRACNDAGGGVVGVFCICPGQWGEHDWGAMKVDFLLRSLAELSGRLGRLNIPLRIVWADRFADVPAMLAALADEARCDAVYFNDEYEVNERARDAAVRAAFEDTGRVVRSFADQTILDTKDIRTTTGGFYTVFTPFRRNWLSRWESEPPGVLPAPQRQAVVGVRTDAVPTELDGFTGHTRGDLWPAGEDAACERLQRFIDASIGAYQKRRDVPGEPGTSALSPYLALGVVSPRACLAAAVQSNGGHVEGGDPCVDCWIGELIWREFYRHVLIGYPHVCMDRPFRESTEGVPWRHDEDQFAGWREGRTGVPIVDAGMRQLAQTGWMHNRVRMITAMFLTKNLLIDWRWGERHFMQHLVDGDFANNNGGWQWSASTGTDAAPYFRIFNPFSQSKRFDPDGTYIRRYVPELVDAPSSVLHKPFDGPLGDYPATMIDLPASRKRALEIFAAL